ncbi:MAG: hypothetical protein H7Y09_14845 [Chitinophagaceae bacterium]|nr:hypothetical protein [Anaerolineae bacterium]
MSEEENFLNKYRRTEEQERLLKMPFKMMVEEVFKIKGRGIVVTGKVESGTLRKGDQVKLMGIDKPDVITSVKGFEGFSRFPDSFVGMAEQNLAILLTDVDAEQVERGMVIIRIIEQIDEK